MPCNAAMVMAKPSVFRIKRSVFGAERFPRDAHVLEIVQCANDECGSVHRSSTIHTHRHLCLHTEIRLSVIIRSTDFYCSLNPICVTASIKCFSHSFRSLVVVIVGSLLLLLLFIVVAGLLLCRMMLRRETRIFSNRFVCRVCVCNVVYFN